MNICLPIFSALYTHTQIRLLSVHYTVRQLVRQQAFHVFECFSSYMTVVSKRPFRSAGRVGLHVNRTLGHSRGMYSRTVCPICKSTTINSPSRECWLPCWQKAHSNTFQGNGSCVLGKKEQN